MLIILLICLIDILKTLAVRAIPLTNSIPVIGKVVAGEFKFYRFVCQDPNKLICFKVKSIYPTIVDGHTNDKGMFDGEMSNYSSGSTYGQIRDDSSGGKDHVGINVNSDPDLYITNRYDGFIEATRNNSLWRSTDVGDDCIYIHPQDAKLSLGRTFVIGVIGYKDMNDFELSATITDPFPITYLSPDSRSDITILPNNVPTYYAIKVSPYQRGSLIVSLNPFIQGYTQSKDKHKKELIRDYSIELDLKDTKSVCDEANRRVYNKYGRCVYTTDELAEIGVLANARQPNKHTDAAVHFDLPSSICMSSKLFPVVYMSATCMFPSPQNYSWRVSHVCRIRQVHYYI